MAFMDLPALQTTEGLAITGAALAVVAGGVLVVRGIRRWQVIRREEAQPARLLIPVQRRGIVPVPLYPSHLAPEANAAAGASDARVPHAGGVVSVIEGAAGSATAASPVDTVRHETPSAARPAGDPLAPVVLSTANGGGTSKVVHVVPPMDGTLQFLPGRLEVLDGEPSGRDIRFVRTWGEVPEITFGRVTGPPYRHVQLRSQTVSRQHARMQYVEGRWKLTNLSQTNPVVINGHPLDTAHGNRVLRDGDEIEMGEVVFRFKER